MTGRNTVSAAGNRGYVSEARIPIFLQGKKENGMDRSRNFFWGIYSLYGFSG